MVEPEELEADFRGMVRRLRRSPLRRATPCWRLQVNFGGRWRTRCGTTLRINMGWLQGPMARHLLSTSPLAGYWTCASYGLRADVVAQEYHLPD